MNVNEPPRHRSASSRRIPGDLSPAGQLPPPELLLAIELLSDVRPSSDQTEDLGQVLVDLVGALVPGVAAIALDPVQLGPGLPAFTVRVGVVSRLPNAGELAAAEDRLRTLELVTLPLPTRNLAIFVALPLLDRAADAELPALQEAARRAGAAALPADIDVRFDGAQQRIVTDLRLARSSGVFDGPWVATLTDQPFRLDLGGPLVGGAPRHRFDCGPALVEVQGGLGRNLIENALRERRVQGVLNGLLDRVQVGTILLARESASPLPGNPHPHLPVAKAAELTYLELDDAADGVRLGGGLALRNRDPEVRAIEPNRVLVLDGAPSHSLRLDAVTHDLRDPLRFQWSLPGGGSFPNPTEARPTLVFDLQGSSPGDVFARDVKVRVRDADGLSAELTRPITLEVISEDQFPDEFPDGKKQVATLAASA